MRAEKLNEYKPDYAIPPGYTISECMKYEEITKRELANQLNITRQTLDEVFMGEAPITPEMSKKLSTIFGASEAFWNNLQRNYEETKERLERENTR
ncbi:MAG: HigA family addiction module antidote protein [PVC group bacterium]|nr:HigA family addiction module antidote protein [PVC group bacterium]